MESESFTSLSLAKLQVVKICSTQIVLFLIVLCAGCIILNNAACYLKI